MNIVVCVKHILDPEMPMEKFQVRNNQVLPPEGVEMVLNPPDAQAVEIALQIKEKYGGKITAICVGSSDSLKAVRRAIAMGADEGVLINEELTDPDSFSTAYILAQAIKKFGAVDLVLCGREAADWSMGVVSSVLAEKLCLPFVTLAKKIEVLENKKLNVERVIPDGRQTFEVSLPAVLTISNEIGLPRLPTGMGIISAARKQIPVWNKQDINADTAYTGKGVKKLDLLNLFIPDRERKCEFIDGDTPVEIVDNLVARLKVTGTM
jgi:electron transfer flavoprotein beta subunit